MKLNNFLIVSIALLFILAGSCVVGAEEVDDIDYDQHALGFNIWYGGSGISYRYFFTPVDAVQFTGSVYSWQSEIYYSVGALYNRVLHQGESTRLLVVPGVILQSYDQFLGSVLRVEFEPARLENINFGISGGYQLQSYGDYINVGPVAGLSLFYSF